MHVLELNFATPEYDEAVRLRYDVLRQPLGLEFDADTLAKEHSDTHLGLYTPELELLAYALLRPEDQTAWMKQVVVRADLQGQGLGRLLVEGFERKAQMAGFTDIKLHARDTAVPFYQKLGYSVYGEPFTEVGIPHQAMHKAL